MADRVFSGKRWTNASGDNPSPGWPCVSQPEGCGCHCHTLSRGRIRAQSKRPPTPVWNTWLKSHDDALRRLIESGESIESVAAALSARFGIPRTVNAVRIRTVRLSLSTRQGWYSRADVCRLLGLTVERVTMIEQSGALEGKQYGHWRRYQTAEVERFVREQAGLLIDPGKVRDAHFRSLAETSAIVNRRRQSA